MWSYLLVSLLGILVAGHPHAGFTHSLVSGTPTGMSTGTITGEVYFLRGGAHAPVEGADVALETGTAHVVTDRHGHFRLPAVAPGSYHMTVSQPHFHAPAMMTVTVTAGRSTTASVKMGQVYYLGVGICNYGTRGMPCLVAPAHDTRALLGLLSKQFWGDQLLLLNRDATKDRIMASLRRIIAGMTPDDYLVFYFSGHGGSDRLEDEGGKWIDYLIPVDDTGADYRRVIDEDALVETFGKIPNPHHALIVLDSCYAGEYAGGKSSHHPDTETARTLDSLGCTILAAADTGELSSETDDGSLFTTSLIEALSTGCANADTNHDRAVTAAEAFTYAASRTTAAAKEFSEVQHPRRNQGEDLVLLRY